MGLLPLGFPLDTVDERNPRRSKQVGIGGLSTNTGFYHYVRNCALANWWLLFGFLLSWFTFGGPSTTAQVYQLRTTQTHTHTYSEPTRKKGYSHGLWSLLALLVLVFGFLVTRAHLSGPFWIHFSHSEVGSRNRCLNRCHKDEYGSCPIEWIGPQPELDQTIETVFPQTSSETQEVRYGCVCSAYGVHHLSVKG